MDSQEIISILTCLLLLSVMLITVLFLIIEDFSKKLKRYREFIDKECLHEKHKEFIKEKLYYG